MYSSTLLGWCVLQTPKVLGIPWYKANPLPGTMKAQQVLLKSREWILWSHKLDNPYLQGWDSETALQPLTCFQRCPTGSTSAEQFSLAPSWSHQPFQAVPPPKAKLIFFLPSQMVHSVALFYQLPIQNQRLVPSGRQRHLLSPVLLPSTRSLGGHSARVETFW